MRYTELILNTMVWDVDRWGYRTPRERRPDDQEFLMEVADFVDPARPDESTAGVCLAIDGSCHARGDNDYCGGCGTCQMMQAAHYGYRIRTGFERMVVGHRLAWEDAVVDLERHLEEEERLAEESVRLMSGQPVIVHNSAGFRRRYGADR